jgi:hypothetical protein
MKTELVLFGKHFKMASQARRRRLVLIFYAAFAALIAASWFIDPSGYGSGFMTIEFTILAGPILGGYLCGWFKPFNVGLVQPFGGNEILKYSAKKSRSALSRLFYPQEGFPGIRNDERDLSKRDHAHFLAYRVLSVLFMLAFLIEFMGRPFSFHPTWTMWSLLGVSTSGVHHAIFLLLQAGYVLALTLPPAIILWTEPDVEEEQAQG